MTPASQSNAVLTVLESERDVGAAVTEMRRSGFDLAKVSVAGKLTGAGMHGVGCHGDGGEGGRVKCWGRSGGFWEGIWETLSGWGLFVVPGIGPVLVAGPLSGWMATGIENEPIFGGLSSFGAGLYSIGISREEIAGYETALEDGRYLVLAHGGATEVKRARAALDRIGEGSGL
jgi:hypothetical protein